MDMFTYYLDCKYPELIGDNYCDDVTNTLECNFDGGDCCNVESNREMCWPCICYVFDYEAPNGTTGKKKGESYLK